MGHLVARALGRPVPLDLARHGRGRDPEPARRLRQGVAGLDPVLDEDPVFQSELSVLSLGHASSPPGARPRGSGGETILAAAGPSPHPCGPPCCRTKCNGFAIQNSNDTYVQASILGGVN